MDNNSGCLEQILRLLTGTMMVFVLAIMVFMIVI